MTQVVEALPQGTYKLRRVEDGQPFAKNNPVSHWRLAEARPRRKWSDYAQGTPTNETAPDPADNGAEEAGDDVDEEVGGSDGHSEVGTHAGAQYGRLAYLSNESAF